MKRSFFQAAIVSKLLYRCTTWTLTKRMEKKLDGNYTRMLQAILNKSWRQHLTSSSYTTTDHPSRKLSKLDEPDTRGTAGEVKTSSWVMYSCGPLHMDEQRQDVQFEHIYSSSVPIRDVAQRICRMLWTIERCSERQSGISVLIARHDDDDDDDIELLFGFWITWILKKENAKIESFPSSADLALNNIIIHTHTHTYIYIKCDQYGW